MKENFHRCTNRLIINKWDYNNKFKLRHTVAVLILSKFKNKKHQIHQRFT